jgi:hypothetical protein
MQRIIMAVTVLAAVGIVSAFAASQLVPSHQAGAAPSATRVGEQNLDASGFIRTHEQGTANVNVTNGSLPVSGTGNLPATQNVNVGSEPAAQQASSSNWVLRPSAQSPIARRSRTCRTVATQRSWSRRTRC